MSDASHTAPVLVPRPARADFAARGEWMSRGRWANADIFRVACGGLDWIMKDFRRCPWFYRWTVGRWMVARELRALQCLDGLDGFPQKAYRVDAYALAYEFQPGTALAKLPRTNLPLALFLQLEALVEEMHRRGVAHLDLRNSGNVIVRPDGRPAVIDFQSHMRLPSAPQNRLRRFMVGVDFSGVYKLWSKRLPGTLGSEREARLQQVNRWRRFWFVRGYGGIRMRKRRGKDAGAKAL